MVLKLFFCAVSMHDYHSHTHAHTHAGGVLILGHEQSHHSTSRSECGSEYSHNEQEFDLAFTFCGTWQAGHDYGIEVHLQGHYWRRV